MKTFFNLKQEVQATGKCHGCGGCVTFCSAVNYGALEMGEDNIPRYKSVEKCIDCGLCYQICPAISSLDDEVKRLTGWSAPAGRILDVHSARIKDKDVLNVATDGGAVTAILSYLMEKGHIDGAIVTRRDNGGRKPFLATTQDEITESAGTDFSHISGMAHLGHHYSTYSPSIQAIGDLIRNGQRRVAFVGTPCQIKSIRKMQVLGIVPSDSIKYCFGLFCHGGLVIDIDKLATFEELAGCDLSLVDKMNMKDSFTIHFKDGQQRSIPLEKMREFRREACRYCEDFSAEFADLSFGGLGSDEGWTTVVTRSLLGRAVFAGALENTLEVMSIDENPGCADQVMKAVLEHSTMKRHNALD